MSVIKKPDLKIFAQDAKTGEIESFPDILRGWGITLERTAGKPPLEWFNAIGKRVDEWLMYLTQRGVAEWDASLSYPKTAIVQFNSIVYVSVKETKGEQPDKSQASWSTLGLFLGLDKYSTTAAMNLELNKKMDKANISGVKGNDNDKVPSLNLFTAETGKLATKAELTSGLASKQPVGEYASGILFYKTINYAGMRPDNLKYAAIMYDDGRFAVWGEDEGRFLWRFSSKGEMTDGLIPLNCGGTGARTASDARTNLSVHSKDEVNTALAGKQPTGNYANGDIFYNTASLVGMRTASKNYALVNFENGDMGGWDESTKSFTFRFDKLGKLINGTVPSSLVTGLAQIGVGQIWQNVTSQRNLNTAYTNSTAKPIFISVTCKEQPQPSTIELWVGGTLVGSYYKDSKSDSAVVTIVPPGSTYTVKASGGGIINWSELR